MRFFGQTCTVWSRFSKTTKIFGARKAIFSSSVSQNGELYAAETARMKRTSVNINNTYKNSAVIIKFEIFLRHSGCENLLGPSRNGPLQSIKENVFSGCCVARAIKFFL